MSHDDIERLARRRAAAKFGFYTHAAVYLLVNAGLVLLSSFSERPWAQYPALGWGLGLAVHGAVVFLLAGGTLERLVQHERERLALQRDPW